MILRSNSSIHRSSSISNSMATSMATTIHTDEESLLLSIPTQPSPSPSTTRHPFVQWTASQLRETAICLVIAIAGFYLPKLLFFPTEEQINSRPLPYTTLASSGEILMDFRYSHDVVYPPTVGSSFLVFTGIWVPLILILTIEFIRKQHPAAILNSLFTAIGLAETLTTTLKFWVRRPRPNYFALCEFSVDTKQCTAPFHKVVEAQLSFPSGHTSLSFCSMTVLVLWLYQMNKSSGNNKWKLFLSALIPWGWATFCGVSRIVDYWHHPSDVLAGCLLGSACATLCYTIHHTTTPSAAAAAAKSSH